MGRTDVAGVAPLAAPARRGRASPAAAAAADLPATSQPPADAPVVLQYSQLVPALLLKRYKRFLGDVQLQLAAGTATVAATDAADDVAVHAPISIHVPNTGPMTGLLDSLPAEALLSVSTDPKRKYAHTLEWLRPVGEGSWVGTHSAKANAMTRQLLERRLLPQLPPYDRLQAEVKYGDGGKSRVDFVLHCDGSGSGPVVIAATAAKRKRGGGGSSRSSSSSAAAAAGTGDASAAATLPAAGQRAAAVSATNGTCCYLEVKSVTLAEDREGGAGRVALFPDTVSDRAQRHVRELTALARAGGVAALVFLVQRDDCIAFAPCHEKDSVYGRLVREAAAAGVLLLPVACALDPQTQSVRFLGALPLDLEYKWQG